MSNETNNVETIKAQVIAAVGQANASAPIERKVTPLSAFTAVQRSLDETRGLPFEVREFHAMRELSSFISLATRNLVTEHSIRHTDLLPIAHPSSTAVHSLTASALIQSHLRWILADSRISEDARPLLASAFLSEKESAEYKYAITRLNALPKGSYPLEALTAAFGDGNSTFARRARAMLQRRDRKGRFAYQGGGVSALVMRISGQVERLTGRTVSTSQDGKTIRMETPDGKLYDVPLSSGEFIKAVINPTADGYSGVPATYDMSDTVINEDSLVEVEAPHGFRRDEDYTGEGIKYTDDAYDVVKLEPAYEGAKPNYEVSRRGGGGVFDTTDSWSGAQIAISVDEDNMDKEEGRQPIARLSDQDIEDMYDDSKNPLDVKHPSGAEPKESAGTFEYTYPDGAYKLTDVVEYEPEGDPVNGSKNFTDDPKELAQRYAGKEGGANIVANALKNAILPGKSGQATGYGNLSFEFDEPVAAEALYQTLKEMGSDAEKITAKIYDIGLGDGQKTNETELMSSREAAKAAPKEELPTPVETPSVEAPAPTDEPNPEDIADAISSADLTDDEIQAMMDGEAIGEADIEGEAPAEIKSKKAAKEVKAEAPSSTVTDEEVAAEVARREKLTPTMIQDSEGNWVYKSAYNDPDPDVVRAQLEERKAAEAKAAKEAPKAEAPVAEVSVPGLEPKPEPGPIIDYKDRVRFTSPGGDWTWSLSGGWVLSKSGEEKVALQKEINQDLTKAWEKDKASKTPAKKSKSVAKPPAETLPEIGGGWSVVDTKNGQAYAKEIGSKNYAFVRNSNGDYGLVRIDDSGDFVLPPKGLINQSYLDTQSSTNDPAELDKIAFFTAKNAQDLVRVRMKSSLNGFDQSIIDAVDTKSPEEIKDLVTSSPEYAEIEANAKKHYESTALNTSAAYKKFATQLASINNELDNLEPLLDAEPPAKEEVVIPEPEIMAPVGENASPSATTPIKTSVAAADLKPGDITYQVENPKFSSKYLDEAFTNYFVVEKTFTDENTPDGKVSVEGYFPGHATQRKEWNVGTPISIIQNDTLPAKGDLPELHRPSLKDEKYRVDGNVTEEGKAQYGKDVVAYYDAKKASAALYSDPVGAYVDDSSVVAPETAVKQAPYKPWKGPDVPAFQGSKLVELVKQADGDPAKLKELLNQEEVTYFDFETDGNSWDATEINPVQIGAHKIKDGQVVDSFVMFMNPGQELGTFYYQTELTPTGKVKMKNGEPVFILDENGNKILKGDLKTPEGDPVTDEWLATQADPNEVMAKFFEWLGPEAILAGHNLGDYDEPILRQQALNVGVEYNPAGFLDTLSLARSAKLDTENNKLGTLTEYFGVELDNWHDASADSMAVKGVLDNLLDHMSKNSTGADQMDPDAKAVQYQDELETYQNQMDAYNQYMIDTAVDKGLKGEPVPSIDELTSKPVEPEGVVNNPSEATPVGLASPAPSKDSNDWVLDDNNTTVIEDKISPVDFKVGDFVPTKTGGFLEIIDIQENSDNSKMLDIKMHLVGTDKTYDNTWFMYNKSYQGVRRPNAAADTSGVGDPGLDPINFDIAYDISDWKLIKSGLGGSNGASLYEDAEGNQFVVKNVKSEEYGRNEALASAFYEKTGLAAGRSYLGKNSKGDFVIVSPFLEGSTTDFQKQSKDPKVLSEAQKGFAIDAWLGNYDSVGLAYDNMVMVDGTPYRIDFGGALMYRAQGADKRDQFTKQASTIYTMRGLNDPAGGEWSTAPQSAIGSPAAKVFGSMTDAQIAESVKYVQAISEEEIVSLVDHAFPTDKATADFLKERLLARREDLITRFGTSETKEPTPSPEVAPEAPTYGPGVVLIDPSKDINQQLEDAIKSGSKVAFFYNDKERLVTPKSIWTNPKNNKTHVRADDAEGVEKNYTLNNIEKSNATISDTAPETPEAPAAISPQELSDKASELKGLPFVEISTTAGGEVVVFSQTEDYKYVISPNSDGTYNTTLFSEPGDGMGFFQAEDLVSENQTLDDAVKAMPALVDQMNKEIGVEDLLYTDTLDETPMPEDAPPADSIKAIDASIEQLSSYIKEALLDGGWAHTINIYNDESGKPILEVETDLGDFQITKTPSGTFNYVYGDQNGNTTDRQGQESDTLQTIIYEMLDDNDMSVEFEETQQGSDRYMDDVVSDIFDGTTTEIPSVDEIVKDVQEDLKSKDITDPNLIVEALKKKYPDHIVLPNGDVIVRRKTVNIDGIDYTYDTTFKRNQDETFSVYIRETNGSTGEVRVYGRKRRVHSDNALNNQIKIMNNVLDNQDNLKKWMTSKKAKPEVMTTAPTEPVNPIKDVADDLAKPEFPKTGEAIVDALLIIVENAAGEEGGIQKILDSLESFPGVSEELANKVTEIVNGTLIKQGASAPNTETLPDGTVQVKKPHVSADGSTAVAVGDKVSYSKDGKTGTVTGLVNAQVTQAGTFGNYAYSDYVWVQFPGDKKPKKRNAKFLTILGTDGTPVPAPEVTPEATPEPKPQPAVDTVIPTVVSPIDVTSLAKGGNLGYVLDEDGSKIIIPTTDHGITLVLNGYDKTEMAIKDLKPGHAITGSPVEGSVPTLMTVISVKDLANGKKEIIVVFQDEDGLMKQRNLNSASDQNGKIVAYVPKGGGDNGGGNPPEDPTPIKPTPGPTSVQEAADFVDIFAASIKNDPATADKIDTASMDSAVDSALEADEASKAGLPTAPTAEEAVSLDWYTEHKNEYAPSYFVTAKDIKPGDVVNGVLITSAEPYPNSDDNSWMKNWTLLKGIKVDSGEESTSSEGTGVLDSVLKHKSSGEVDPFEGLPKITPADVKNKKQYKGIKKLFGDELQIGDVIVGKGGNNPFSYQIIAIEKKDGKNPRALVRLVTPHDSGRSWWMKKNGSVMYIGLPQSGFNGAGYNNVKRPTEEFNKATADKVAAAKLPKAPSKKKTDGKVQTFDSKVEVMSQGIDKTTKEFTDYMGANDYSEYKSGMTGLFVKSSNDKYIMPGLVVSDEAGNTGIATNTNSDDNSVEITWLTGPDAGSSTSAKSNTLTSEATFIKFEDAANLGVDIDTTVNDKSKAKIAAIQEQKAKEAAEAAAKAAKLAEYKKMLADNSVGGSGVDEPVAVPDDLDWTTDVFEGVPSVAHIIDSVKDDVNKASVGVQALVDSDSIEDNRVRIYRVQDTDGTWKTRIRFKLTDWAANKKIADDSAEASKSKRMEFIRWEKQPDGSIKRSDTWNSSKIDTSNNGATYTLDVADSDGKLIGEVLIHRANKDASTPDYGKSAHSSSEALSYHNEVDIFLPDNATPEQIKAALETAGVKEARPATKEDVRITAENKIIALFADKSNGSLNYKGELREKILKDAKDKYELDAADIVPVVINNGDITFLMPEDVAEKLAIKTNATYFNHDWKSGNLPPSGKARAQFFFDLLTTDGLRSTVERWASGINVSGMSSTTDGKAVGANYVFTSKSQSPHGVFSFDGKKLLRRLDFYANGSDSFGQKKDGKDILKEISAGYVYEILFKGTISWADLANINVDSATRDALIELLTGAGIDNFGGTPLNKIFGV